MISDNGCSISVLDIPIHRIFIKNANLIICGNYQQLCAIQLDNLKILMKQSVTYQTFALIPDDDALIVVDKQLLVTLYRININQ